ncbi:MAG TPA: gluconokinase [Candidatus Cybelea sp.]|nr:gluconokinase [Candidatus Cybelea sp.]
MIVVIMGVSGAGKTTVGKLLAEQLDAAFLEGDAFHPPGNIAKMQAGEPLDDDDRRPWLESMARELARCEASDQSVVLACSALKRRYRDILRAGCPGVTFVYLSGTKELIRRRITSRSGHFMPPALLDSQFAALEAPSADEAIVVDVGETPDAIAARAAERLKGD